MMSNKLTSFILTGNIEKLSIGQPLDTSEGEWISSFEQHSNGIPKLRKCTLDELVINVGVTSENKVGYLVVHVNDLDQKASLHIGKIASSLTRMTLDELLVFLNESGIEWSFKTIFEKIIILLIEQSNIEIIFSYYPDEIIGLQTIQVNGGYDDLK